jgi:hypothetical protein
VVSVALQVEPLTGNCVTVVTNGVPGAAVPDDGVAVPLQVTETGTLAVGPLGE